MMEFEQLTAELKRLRDEIALKIHLGSKDAQAQWAELEKQWETFAAEARLHESAGDVGQAARALGDELKTSFERIRDALR